MVEQLEVSDIHRQIGGKPELIWVRVELIDVDNNYQREIKPRLVKKILKGFRWDHFGAVVLAPQENGRYHVTDGQHRTKAASLHPDIDEVPAMIMNGGGMESEAQNFLAINRDRQSVNVIDRYWAGITANDADCLLAAAVLKQASCDVVPERGASGINLTNAVTALQRAIRFFGDKAVVQALVTIRYAWPNDRSALRGVLITTLSRLFRHNENIDHLRLEALLRAESYAAMAANAEVFRKLSGGSADTNLARTIAAAYNKGLPKNAHIGLKEARS